MDYKIPVKKDSYHKAVLMVLNFNLKLSNMEMDILATLLNYNITIVDIEAREILRKVLDKGKFNINNYVSRLKDKGVFVTKPADKKLYINPVILGIIRSKKISFEFEIVNQEELSHVDNL